MTNREQAGAVFNGVVEKLDDWLHDFSGDTKDTSEVDEIWIDAITAALDAAAAEGFKQGQVHERETIQGALCPEDVGIAEYVLSLEKKAYEQGKLDAAPFALVDAVAATAQERERCAKIAEAYLHVDPPAESRDTLDHLARYSNGTVRRIAAAIRTPTAEE